jgi:hypothetical protein
MSHNKLIFFLLIFLFGIYNHSIQGQALNINGDTIFLNTKTEIQLVFPTLPTNFKTVPLNTQYRIWDSPTGINLIAQSENHNPATLLVSEAKRIHHFILIFKKNIRPAELKTFYDYSTEKKLAQHISETALKSIASIKPGKKNQEKQTVAAVAVDSSLNYNALLEQGDKNLALKNYQEAKLNFDKAHVLRPGEITPLLRLEVVKIKLEEIEKSAKQENDKKYVLLTEEAKNKIEQKKYTEARNIYNMVLTMKPGDAYVTQQLQTINSLVAGESAETKKQKIDAIDKEKVVQGQKEVSNKQLTTQNNYDTTVALADSFFNAGDYENAKREYSRALKFSNKDWPKSQINKIDKIIKEQTAQANADKQKAAQKQKVISEPVIKADTIISPAEIKKKYNTALAMAKSSYIKNDLLAAKAFYEEAINLQTTQQGPKNQLQIINRRLEDSARETELNNNYERAIALGDSMVIAKAYDSAIASYKKAALLKPLESYPWKQVKYIQSELVYNEKRKKEEKEQQYNTALMKADNAVKDKKYDDAKSSYEKALSLHPENEYAKRRLEIVSYQLQLEKARIEKLSQDSVREVVPVKKSKRKKSS